MPTNNKTSLGLNSWLGTDKPKRSDFVEDNTLLDSLLNSHFADNTRHFTADDRTLLSQAFVMGTYIGDGQAQQVITLPFAPRLVIVFYMRKGALSYRSGYYENNFGIIGPAGAMTGLYLDKDKLTVCQDATAPAAGGVKTNLNSSNGMYVYTAFR